MNTGITRGISKLGLAINRHTPEILTVASAALTVGAVIMAIKKTRKVDDILEQHEEGMKAIKEVHEEPEKYLKEGEEYSEEDYKKDLATTYVKTGVELAKLYWPCVVMGGASIACAFAANGIMRGRNAALASSYALLSSGWKEYRSRVAEKFGEEVERQIFSGETEVEEVELVTDEKGKEKAVVHKKKTYKPSGYARVFEPGNINWSEFHSNNLVFLQQEQKYANDRLVARGFLTLAEVYERLGFEVTSESLCVGWIFDKHNNAEGDNYVDFGFRNTPPHNFDDDLADHNSCVFLDFNVDGPIIDRIPSNYRGWNRD